MKFLRAHILFSVGAAAYVALYFCKANSIVLPPIIANYIADLLALPVILSIAKYVIRYLKNLPQFQLSTAMILFSWVYISLLFEVFLPVLNDRFTADVWDVVVYAFGALGYYYFQKGWYKKSSAITSLQQSTIE